MSGPGDQLAYNLYLDAARTVVWGDGSGGTSVYANARPPNNQWVTVTVYARVGSGQDVTVGSYTDSIVATILY